MAAAANCFKICLQDLNKKCSVQLHTITQPKIGTTNAGSTLTEIYSGWFQIKTLSIQGTIRINGVNISKAATHTFTTRFRSALKDLDADGETFIERSDRKFKVLEITNLNEDDEWLIFQCSERGLDTEEANFA